MKILIVDDSKAMRSIVLRALRQAGFGGHSFAEASNGAEALAAIEADCPDLVLADWNMPEMSGVELLQALRERGNEVTFGFITSESTAEIRELALKSGAAFLITKPFNAETLQKTLAGVIV